MLLVTLESCYIGVQQVMTLYVISTVPVAHPPNDDRLHFDILNTEEVLECELQKYILDVLSYASRTTKSTLSNLARLTVLRPVTRSRRV